MSINLLPLKVAKKQKTVRLVGKANYAGSILFSIFLLVAAGLGGYLFLLGRSLTSLTSQSDLLKVEINARSHLEQISDKLSAKSAALITVFNERQRFSYLLEVFSSVIPQGVTVTEFSTEGEEEKLAVSGTANDYPDLSRFLESAVSPETKGGDVFSQVDLTSVSLDDRTGKARFSVKITLKKDALKEPAFK